MFNILFILAFNCLNLDSGSSAYLSYSFTNLSETYSMSQSVSATFFKTNPNEIIDKKKSNNFFEDYDFSLLNKQIGFIEGAFELEADGNTSVFQFDSNIFSRIFYLFYIQLDFSRNFLLEYLALLKLSPPKYF